MKYTFVTLALAVVAIAVPFTRRDLTHTLLLDAPGYQDSNNPSDTLVAFKTYAYLGGSGQHFLKSLDEALKAIGIDPGEKLSTAAERMKLFSSIGRPADKVRVSVQGCSNKNVDLPRTSFKDMGIGQGSVSVGSCTGEVTGTADNSPPARVFLSPPEGFGVISDIDDTIKITNVLDDKAMIENTLFKDPLPVPEMPDVYQSLAQSLTSESIPPIFLYVSGSPLQLYPFIDSFLKKTYSASIGPIFLQDFSVTDLKLIGKMIAGGETKSYKEAQINKIHRMYPEKSFLAVGDSTQQDPEVYGDMFRKFGVGFIRCIWIHKVDKANNKPERFEAAFKDVPKEKYRLYTTAEIGSLKAIDVANGHC